MKTLRRPISICDINGSEFRLVFEVRGEGTDILSQTEVGGEVDVIAPLGNGFKIEPDKGQCLLEEVLVCLLCFMPQSRAKMQ